MPFDLFSSLSFLNPLILGALAVLPLLWLFLRVTPPSPKRISFPAARFLSGLVSEEKTPSKTPWWLLLLRLLALAFIIFALAHPVANMSESVDLEGDIRIVVDNDWSAAQNWDRQIQKGLELLNEAKRKEVGVTILTTAPESETRQPFSSGPIPAGEAQSILRALQPKPWFSDYGATSKMLAEGGENEARINTFWLSSGVRHAGQSDLTDALLKEGTLNVFQPEGYRLPYALKSNPSFTEKPSIRLLVPQGGDITGKEINVQALARDGRVLGFQSIVPETGKMTHDVLFDIPSVLRSEIVRFSILNARGAAASYLLDDRFVRRSVGIVASGDTADEAPLIEAQYYLERALQPYASLQSGTVDELLEADISVMMMPDMASLPIATLNALEDWVQNGGVLLRFAGPSMTQNLSETFLVPTPLRAGGRALSGSLSWEEPLKLGPYPENSPFYGMAVPDDVTVKQQILAEPVQGLENKTWAVLEDGTPLITAANKGNGLLIFVHTTPTPEWSNLALSGTFLTLLQRIVNLSGKSVQTSGETYKTLEPLSIMDGFGRLNAPDNSTKPISTDQGKDFTVSAIHPPGIYGRAAMRQALNIGDHINAITQAEWPLSVKTHYYDTTTEQDYRPPLALIAMLLLLLDWVIVLILHGGFRFRLPKAAIQNIVLALLVAPFVISAPVQASNDDFDLQYSDQLHLAYIKSGNPGVDKNSQRGLEVLAQVLKRRTSVEPAGAIGLDIRNDTLSFFPLIYWPISGTEQPLEAETIRKIQSYLDHGGTILFDTRDQNIAAQRLGGSANAATLRRMISGLNIPALEHIPDDHVLTKSFYLLDRFPGLYDGGVFWVEGQSDNGRDGVSSVLIGSHDWASAWANADGSGRSFRGQNRQQELALRFGVNLVMYALTGNYKADQVHVPFILERLGQ